MAFLDIQLPLHLFFFYLFLGITPSLIWLLYYLKKDIHPEPKRMIVRVFILGMLATIPVIAIETYAQDVFDDATLPNLLTLFLYFIVGVALVEEFF